MIAHFLTYERQVGHQVTISQIDYQADIQNSLLNSSLFSILKLEKAIFFRYKKKTVVNVFNKWIVDISEGQCPSVTSNDFSNELNKNDFYQWFQEKGIRLFIIPQSEFKTFHGTAINLSEQLKTN